MPIIGNITYSLLEDHPVSVYLSKLRIFMSSPTSLLANVEGGIGVTILSELAAPDRHPRVVFRTLQRPQVRRIVGILVRRGRVLRPQAQAMRDHILEQFRRSACDD